MLTNQINKHQSFNVPKQNSQGSSLFLNLLPMMLLLWAFLLLRLVNIADFPFFVDETRHIERARIIWSFSDLQTSTTPGKFLLYYWMGAFGMPANAAQWLSRTSVVIFSVLGAAATFALARRLFSWSAGIIALAILSVFPFMLFYERLALTDPMTASLVILTTWWSIVVAQHPTYRRSIGLGLLLSLMLMSKILAAPMLILPVLAMLLVSPFTLQALKLRLYQKPKAVFQLFKQTYLSYLIPIFGTVGLVWGMLLLFYVGRVLFDPDGVSPILETYLYRGLGTNLGLDEQQSNPLSDNMERLVQGMFYMWRPLLLLITAVSLPIVWRYQKTILLFLLTIIIGMWIPLVVVAGRLSTRYLTLVGHVCIVLIAGGIWALSRELRQQTFHKRIPPYAAWLPIIAIGIWITSTGIPFWTTLIDDPTALVLPERDQHEYFRNQTGFAIQEILETVETLPPISSNVELPIVVGMVRNCQYLPYHIATTRQYDLECPQIGHDLPNRPHTDLNALLAQYGSLYVMVEEFDTSSSSPQIIYWCLIEGDAHHIATYQRPFNGVNISLYEVDSMPLVNKVSTCGQKWIKMWMASAYRFASSDN